MVKIVTFKRKYLSNIMNIIYSYNKDVPKYKFKFLKKEYNSQYNVTTFCCENNKKFVGCVDVSKRNNKLFIENLYVNKGFRKQGIETKLLNQALSNCKNNDIYLETKENWLIKWYKKFGFELIDKDDDIFVMKKFNYN